MSRLVQEETQKTSAPEESAAQRVQRVAAESALMMCKQAVARRLAALQAAKKGA